jgi:predicted ATPase
MLEFLARELAGCRLLVVGTYRDTEIVPGHPLNQTLGEMAREPTFPQLSLRGLDEQDEGRFIELAAGFNPPVDLVKAVHAVSEGNPLFMTEIVRLLADTGELNAESDASSQQWKIRIPGAINSGIQSRLDRLSQSCQQLVRVAALTGRDFDLGLLEWLTADGKVEIDGNVSVSSLLELLEEALATQVIEEVPDSVGRYQFTHALIQETLASQLSSVRRARMHAAIGEAVEDRFQDRAFEHAAEIAYHFGRADAAISPDKQARYYLLAEDQALAAHAAEEALPHFEKGLAALNITLSGSIIAPDEQAAELLFGLAKAQKATLPRNR